MATTTAVPAKDQVAPTRPARRSGPRIMARLGLAAAAAASLVSGVGLVGPAQPAEAASPPKIKGVQWVSGVSPANSDTVKTAVVECPYGKRALGGGATIEGLPASQVVPTQITPFYESNGRSGYTVTAVETYKGTSNSWYIRASAYCADPPPGYRIVTGGTSWSSNSMQETLARCPEGQRALGAGARVVIPTRFIVGGFQLGTSSLLAGSRFTGEMRVADGFTMPGRMDTPAAAGPTTAKREQGVGIQMMRASGPGDLTRARAHEAPEGYAHQWRLYAYAVCADAPKAYQVVYGEPSYQRASESQKVASVKCPKYWDYSIPFQQRQLKRQVVGIGVAIASSVPGNVTLQELRPAYEGNVVAVARENSATPAFWDTIAAQAICVG